MKITKEQIKQVEKGELNTIQDAIEKLKTIHEGKKVIVKL